MVGTIYLLYHELGMSGRELCDRFLGHPPYAVLESEFRAQMCLLRKGGWHGTSVSETLASPEVASRRVVITVDDGSETDLLGVAPLLSEAGFNATFYVVVGWLGKSGYLSASQLRELSSLGFEIGCHSMSHPFLTSLDDAALNVEVAQAKVILEDICGTRVDHFSCPGGFWSPRVAHCAKLAGYHSVATSRPGVNTARTNSFCLARVSVMRGVSTKEFERLPHARGLFARRAKHRILSIPKALLGADAYARLHSAFRA
jgi:peptidoglycan/xylan/chitin deacetylase (PgdA/CDA1 family)